MKKLCLALVLSLVLGLMACSSSSATSTSTITSTSTTTTTITNTSITILTSPTTITVTSTVMSPTTVTITVPSPATSTTSISSTTQSTSSISATYQELAVDGHVVYTSTCASCHGGDGQGGVGPALWGQYYVPGMYNGTKLFNNNAQDMLTFIETNMPFSSAGSLTHQQAIDVLCYLLIQENEISPSDIFIESQLSSVILN